jgi:hypothetical protein
MRVRQQASEKKRTENRTESREKNSRKPENLPNRRIREGCFRENTEILTAVFLAMYFSASFDFQENMLFNNLLSIGCFKLHSSMNYTGLTCLERHISRFDNYRCCK